MLHRRASLIIVDVLLMIWAVAWVAVGVQVAHEVDGLSRLSDTVATVGRAVDSSGQALESIAGIPLVGDRVRGPAARVREAGRSALASGRRSRESVHNLSPLLGFAVALIPTVPLLAIYLPLRVVGLRERRAVIRLVREHRDDPRLSRLLAQRALSRLSYGDLAAATLDANGGDPARGSTELLAAAELARVGVRR